MKEFEIFEPYDNYEYFSMPIEEPIHLFTTHFNLNNTNINHWREFLVYITGDTANCLSNTFIQDPIVDKEYLNFLFNMEQNNHPNFNSDLFHPWIRNNLLFVDFNVFNESAHTLNLFGYRDFKNRQQSISILFKNKPPQETLEYLKYRANKFYSPYETIKHFNNEFKYCSISEFTNTIL